jgi:hypothetical protein
VRGLQVPRICHHPEYVSSAGREAIEIASLARLNLDPWQQFTLTHALGERADGKWAAFEVGLCVSRQNGKGSCLEARELAGLFSFGERLIVHSAHEQATSSEHFRRLLTLIEEVPEFDRRVLKVVKGKGSEAIELRDGYRVLFKTRTGGGGRGLTGDLVVLDEAMILPIAVTGALVPTMAARSVLGNPQLWYAGSSVDALTMEHGVVFAGVRARGMAGAEGVAWFEWSAGVREWLEARGLPFDEGRPELDQVTGDMLADRTLWAQANPGMGIRISVEHVAREHGGALRPRQFATERDGIGLWPDISDDADRVIAKHVWERCADADSAIEGRPTFAVDVAPSRSSGSIAVAGTRADGLSHIEVVEHRPGTGWIPERCQQLQRVHHGKTVVDPRGPAGSLVPDLRKLGVRLVEKVDTGDYADACGDLFDAVTSLTVRYPAPQPELDAALAAARKAPLGDRWKWSRQGSGGADISPLVAATLALWGHSRRKSRARVINPYDYV